MLHNCGSSWQLHTHRTISPAFAPGCSRLPGSDYNSEINSNSSLWNWSSVAKRNRLHSFKKKKRAGSEKYSNPRADGSIPRLQISVNRSTQVKRDGCRGLQVLTALQFAPPLAVGGGWHADVHHVVPRGLVVGRALSDLFLRDDAIDFWGFFGERWKQKQISHFPHVKPSALQGAHRQCYWHPNRRDTVHLWRTTTVQRWLPKTSWQEYLWGCSWRLLRHLLSPMLKFLWMTDCSSLRG